jgi:2-keto-4-pentenoate hydratase/2-oxohepta-3-ene-1,7-dioic acid hydratase in catechol pathway
MKLASWTMPEGASFGLINGDGGVFDLGRRANGRFSGWKHVFQAGVFREVSALAQGAHDLVLEEIVLLPPIPDAGKIVCVGVNYPDRNAEYRDGSEMPKYPSLFVRFPASFVGHGTPILRPPESEQFDYEGEIVIVIGRRGRRIPEAEAASHVFGLTLMNEGSVRDWIRHGKFNVTQGKNFDRSGAIGPWITPLSDQIRLDDLTVTTAVNGEERQRGHTGTLAFSFARIIAYVSTFTTLEPGDLIATGTPPGAGGRFDPPRWLKPGDLVDVTCPAIGTLSNPVVDEEI